MDHEVTLNRSLGRNRSGAHVVTFFGTCTCGADSRMGALAPVTRAGMVWGWAADHAEAAEVAA